MRTFHFARPAFYGVWAAVCACLVAASAVAPLSAAEPAPLTMVVMDPLALPLSCPCVQGYAQRDYDKLAEKLSRELGRPVNVVFNESLKSALEGDAQGSADIVIGKRSVVLYDAQRTKHELAPVAALSNKEGGTTMNGLIVVPADDAATTVSALKDYRLIFGPAESDEKHSAAIALLREHDVEIPQELETAAACDEGAIAILEGAKNGEHGAAVISSYAAPLLEGCGTVPKGALRVVGKTAPVPFIQAFVRADWPQAERDRVAAALRKSTVDPLLRIALETRDGFVQLDAEEQAAAKKK